MVQEVHRGEEGWALKLLRVIPGFLMAKLNLVPITLAFVAFGSLPRVRALLVDRGKGAELGIKRFEYLVLAEMNPK